MDKHEFIIGFLLFLLIVPFAIKYIEKLGDKIVLFATNLVLFLLIAPLALIALVLCFVAYIVIKPFEVCSDFSDLHRSYKVYLESCNKLEEKIAELDHGFLWKRRMPETLKFWHHREQYENLKNEWEYLGDKLAELDPTFEKGWKTFIALSLIRGYLRRNGSSLNSFRNGMYSTGTTYARI